MLQGIASALQRHWWRPDRSLLVQALRPLSWVYAGMAALARRFQRPAARVPRPTIVVGNLIVGGAGKTPTVVALVLALKQAGWRPGVISRAHGSAGQGLRAVQRNSQVSLVGDEPLLIHRRTGVPVWVGRSRSAVARALCAAHPEVNLLVSDDGLQHRRLARDLELIVFDERGVGNGLLLPAGPMRQALPLALLPHQWVLYNAASRSTPLPGSMAQRRLGPALPLERWWVGSSRGALSLPELARLAGPELWAVAGIAAPERFFNMLRDAGLAFHTLPLPDHHAFDTLPWPEGSADVIVTEKDAVKLAGRELGTTRVWVVGLDFVLPPMLLQILLSELRHITDPP